MATKSGELRATINRIQEATRFHPVQLDLRNSQMLEEVLPAPGTNRAGWMLSSTTPAADILDRRKIFQQKH